MMTISLLILAAIIIWAIIIYNRLVRDRQRVLTAWSDIDVQLKRRYDLIPKLVAVAVAAGGGDFSRSSFRVPRYWF